MLSLTFFNFNESMRYLKIKNVEVTQNKISIIGVLASTPIDAPTYSPHVNIAITSAYVIKITLSIT
jgi:hypothetical protein